MRDIKFRGKRIDNNEWIYGYYKKYLNDDNKFEHTITNVFGECFIVDGETVGQFTGLKNKNGKEIYEGDIYHQGDKNIKYVVVWNDTGLIGKQLGSRSYAGLSYWQDKIEVICNIYEDPELLDK